MKTNRQTKKLSEICEFYNGLWKGKEAPYINVGVIRNTNFTKDGTLDDTDIAYLPVEIKQFSKRKLSFGDIILEKSGGGPKQPVGRVIVFDKKNGDYSFSNFTSAIRIKNSDELDFNFLHKFLYFSYISGITESMQSHSTGIRNLDLNTYKEIEISYPPLPEQKRIVKTLDEAFKKLEKAKDITEKNLRNSKELFESYLQELFKDNKKDWKINTLKEVTLKIGSGATPRGGKESYTTIGTALVRSMNVHDRFFKEKNLAYINEKQAKDLQNVTLIENDVLLNITGASVARSCIFPKEFLPARVNQHVSIIRANKDIIDPVFLNFLLTSTFYKKQLLATGEQGSTRQAITKFQLEGFLIKYPNLTEQKAIVKKLDQLSEQTKKLESIYQKKLSAIEELKRSILSKAFSKGL